LLALDARSGAVRWKQLPGGGGAVVANGMVYTQSGYYPFYPSEHGAVLLAFGLPRS
jgi:polyvinyl alcohol dehydrogenase (cytochrome)